MKIFHMGDWHIGKLVNGFYMTEDQEYMLEKLCNLIEEKKPDVLIIAGDLYDRSVPPVHAVELLNKYLRKIVKDLNTKVIAIAGNHDSNERIDFASSLLYESGLYIYGNLKRNIDKIILEDEYGKVNFYPIPYADVPVVREVFKDENIKSYDKAFEKIIEEINKDFNEDERNVAIAHGYITKISDDEVESLEECDSEKPLAIGGTEFINYKHFEKFNYTALGHLHGPQKVGCENIRYSGSLMKYSFSEVNQKKGITIVDIDKEGKTSVEFLEIKPIRDFRVIKGKIDELLKGYKEGKNDDYIKVILEDKGEILDPMAKLRAVYPNVMELIREEKLLNKSYKEALGEEVKKKSKMDLFKSFYNEVSLEELDSDEISIMEEIIYKAERGEFDDN